MTDIDALIEAMTVEEKLAQLGCVWSTQLVDDHGFSPDAARRLLAHGTGQVTRALLEAGISAERLVLIEREPELAAFLHRHFPEPCIVEGDAARLPDLLQERRLGAPAAIVSSLPLLSLPAEVVNGIVGGVFESLPAGGALVQFTYGPKPPVPRCVRPTCRPPAEPGAQFRPTTRG